MELLSTVDHGCPVARLRFHPRERLLASVAGPAAEVAVWGWDEAGSLRCLDRIRRTEGGRVLDVAWHPIDRTIALVGVGRPIEIWSQGAAIRSLGAAPEPGRQRPFTWGEKVGDGPFEVRREMREVPVEEQGYDAVAFSARGDRLVACRFGGGSEDGDPTEVYDVASGDLVGTFWCADTTLALHPEGHLLATLSSNQMASAVRFGRLGEAFQGYNAELAVDADGYERLVWSPRGDRFALMGNNYYVGVRVFEFPSCRMHFAVDFEEWEDVWDRLWVEFRGADRYAARPDGRFPYEFIRDLWPVKDRVAFHPDGRTLLFGTMHGFIWGVDPEDASNRWKSEPLHDGPLLALDVSTPHGLLATARCDGEIKLWRLDGAPCPPPDGTPLTEAFCRRFQPIDSTASEEQFRVTDGRRWYDLATIGDEELDDDAPPWAQIAHEMARYRREEK